MTLRVMKKNGTGGMIADCPIIVIWVEEFDQYYGEEVEECEDEEYDNGDDGE